jgi:hypothetical protein
VRRRQHREPNASRQKLFGAATRPRFLTSSSAALGGVPYGARGHGPRGPSWYVVDACLWLRRTCDQHHLPVRRGRADTGSGCNSVAIGPPAVVVRSRTVPGVLAAAVLNALAQLGTLRLRFSPGVRAASNPLRRRNFNGNPGSQPLPASATSSRPPGHQGHVRPLASGPGVAHRRDYVESKVKSEFASARRGVARHCAADRVWNGIQTGGGVPRAFPCTSAGLPAIRDGLVRTSRWRQASRST